MLRKTSMNDEPERVHIDELPEGGQYILLHDNAEQVDIPTEENEPPQKMWECDEAAFRLGPDRVQTAESLERDFDAWWVYGAAWDPDAAAPTVEERLADLEAAMLALMEV